MTLVQLDLWPRRSIGLCDLSTDIYGLFRIEDPHPSNTASWLLKYADWTYVNTLDTKS